VPALPSGGGGLYSTAADYLHFAQMMLNGGELNGKRLLKRTPGAANHEELARAITYKALIAPGASRH
jgi:CubicO group peptidase (beta-lactamase class C family)